MGINRTSIPGPGVRFMTKISQSTDLKGRTSSSQRSGPKFGNFFPNLKSHGSRCPNCPNSKCQLGSFLEMMGSFRGYVAPLSAHCSDKSEAKSLCTLLDFRHWLLWTYAEVNGGSFSEISGVSAPRRISRVDISVHRCIWELKKPLPASS